MLNLYLKKFESQQNHYRLPKNHKWVGKLKSKKYG